MTFQNRVIKFRVWDAHFQKMCYCNPLKFHSVSLHMKKLDKYPVFGQVLSPVDKSLEKPYAHSDAGFFDDSDDRYTILQYTGITDANGVEIYEGDLLINDYDDKFVSLVSFNNENHGEVLGWNLLSYGEIKDSKLHIFETHPAVTFYYGESPSNRHKVVGNIFEGLNNEQRKG